MLGEEHVAAKDRFESLQGLTTVVVSLLALDIVLQLLYGGASLAVISLIDGLLDGSIVPEDDGLAPSEIVQSMVGLVSVLVSVSLFFIIGRWIYRAAWNVRHLGAKRLEFSPGWAVGWYFVPFANLVMPYRAMKEIWLASRSPQDWQPGPAGLLPLWWGLWLAGGVLGNISMRLNLRADTLEQMRIAEWVGIAQCAIAVPLALVFIHIARTVSAAQDQHPALADPPPLPAQAGA